MKLKIEASGSVDKEEKSVKNNSICCPEYVTMCSRPEPD